MDTNRWEEKLAALEGNASPIGAKAKLISARDALLHATRRLRSPKKAKTFLEGLLRGGRLFGTAEVWVEEVDFGTIALTPPTKERHLIKLVRSRPMPSIILAPGFFADCGISFYDSELWKWDHSVFAALAPPPVVVIFSPSGSQIPSNRMRYVAYNVHFGLSAVEALLDTMYSSQSRGATNHSGETSQSITLTYYDWTKYLSDFWTLASRGELVSKFGQPELRGTQARIEDAILERMVETNVSIATVRRKVKKLMKADAAARSASTLNEPS